MPWATMLAKCTDVHTLLFALNFLKNMKIPFTKLSFFAHHYHFDSKFAKHDLKRGCACLCTNCLSFNQPQRISKISRKQVFLSIRSSWEPAQPSPLPLKTLPNQMHFPAVTAEKRYVGRISSFWGLKNKSLLPALKPCANALSKTGF